MEDRVGPVAFDGVAQGGIDRREDDRQHSAAEIDPEPCQPRFLRAEFVQDRR